MEMHVAVEEDLRAGEAKTPVLVGWALSTSSIDGSV